ncbi:MAG: phosphoribosylanthranilate isomerase [Eubacteriales bacterium]|nr:phosphoribosylanthranilate isomerase [Eubacteriales bacterium]
MTKIKLCGLSRSCDIEAVNDIMPEYVGFVFASKSKRYVTPEKAAELKALLKPNIQAVGVFVREAPETVARLLSDGIIDMAQLHGGEDEAYLKQLRQLTDKPIIQAFRIQSAADITKAEKSSADFVLLDSGAGTGTTFDWGLIQSIRRPYFLAGGLSPDNVADAVAQLKPYAVDVSSGIETGGLKDQKKMTAFAAAVRKEEAL